MGDNDGMTTPPEHRLLAVFAHPDDETIGAGGLLALAVAAGVDVSVVTCTRGEQGEVIPPELGHLTADPDRLARRREQELSAALAELGVHRLLLLDQVPGLDGARPARFRDSGMRWVRPGIAGPAESAGPDAFSAVDVEVAARLLAVVIRHLRPTAVLTEEPGGGYGHPDHVHAHRVTMRAVELAGAQHVPPVGDAPDPLAPLAPWRVPTVLWVAQDEAHLRAAMTELRDTLAGHPPRHAPDGTVLTVPELGEELPGVAVPSHELAASFDVRPVAERVLAALRRHRTQVQAVAPIDGERLVGHLALSNAALMPVLDRVYLRPAPGSDAGALAAVLAAGPRRAAGAVPAPERAAAGSAPAAATTSADHAPSAPVDHARSAPVDHAPSAPADHARNAPADHPPARSASAAGAPTTDSAPARAGDAEPSGASDGGPAATHVAGSAATTGPDPDRCGTSRPGDRPRGGVLGRLVDAGGATGVAVALVAGAVMGMLGTVVHRYELGGWPVGVALGLLGVLAAAVAARAIAGGGGLLLAVLAVVVITQAMAFLRPGGDVLVTNEVISYVWLFGAPLMCIAAAFLPARWFADGEGRRP